MKLQQQNQPFQYFKISYYTFICKKFKLNGNNRIYENTQYNAQKQIFKRNLMKICDNTRYFYRKNYTGNLELFFYSFQLFYIIYRMAFWASSLNLEDYIEEQPNKILLQNQIKPSITTFNQELKKIKSMQVLPACDNIRTCKSLPKKNKQFENKFNNNQYIVVCKKKDIAFKKNSPVLLHEKKISTGPLNEREVRNKKIPSFLEKIIQQKDVINRTREITPKNHTGKNKFFKKNYKDNQKNDGQIFKRQLQQIGNLSKSQKMRKETAFLNLSPQVKQIQAHKSEKNLLTRTSTRAYELLVKQSNQNKKKVLDQFYIFKQLGKGQYGNVILAIQKHIGMICAIKIIQKFKIREQQSLKHLINEIKIQLFINHPNIIKMYGFLHDEQAFYIIMQPALDGPLHTFISKKKSIPETQAVFFIKQIGTAIKCLHENHIIHRDLKSQNMLLHNNIVKICDFGWATHHFNLFRQTFCGTPLYLSPQILKCQKYNQKVDLWSLGVLIYQMVTGSYPFVIKNEREMIKILQEQIVFPENGNLSNSCCDFIRKCLTKDPMERPTIFELLNHQFIIKQQ